MKKPEKMETAPFDNDNAWYNGYNRACEDWEKWLKEKMHEPPEVGHSTYELLLLALQGDKNDRD